MVQLLPVQKFLVFSKAVQTAPGSKTVSYSVCTRGCFPGVKVTPLQLMVSRLRITGVIYSVPICFRGLRKDKFAFHVRCVYI